MRREGEEEEEEEEEEVLHFPHRKVVVPMFLISTVSHIPLSRSSFIWSLFGCHAACNKLVTSSCCLVF